MSHSESSLSSLSSSSDSNDNGTNTTSRGGTPNEVRQNNRPPSKPRPSRKKAQGTSHDTRVVTTISDTDTDWDVDFIVAAKRSNPTVSYCCRWRPVTYFYNKKANPHIKKLFNKHFIRTWEFGKTENGKKTITIFWFDSFVHHGGQSRMRAFIQDFWKDVGMTKKEFIDSNAGYIQRFEPEQFPFDN